MSGDDRELVARLLDAARRDVAADEAQRQEKVYERVIGGPAAGGGGPPIRSGLLGSWIAISAAGLGALALVGAAALALGTGSAKTGEPPAPAGASTPSTSADTPSPADVSEARNSEVPASASAAGSIGTSVWELPSVATSERPAAPGMTAMTASDELALELAALANARKKLREQDPAGAMKLLDDFDRRFPRPRAGEEAIVLRVEVLFGLGRADDARRIGQQFVARHPDSIYRARVVQLLGDAPP